MNYDKTANVCNSGMKRKRISKKEASQKYGVTVSGINSLYTYYLREDGCVVDGEGDIRYYPPGWWEIHGEDGDA